ncbi:MAG: hypothetical protein CMF72_10425 [Mameliella sp.]|nr:hypothetical protein [Mameliella sp.]|tara:strand:+ start:1240 stop:1434 length:195 start_codon:yes stop_codon:yes gene_type:complete
MTDNESEAKSGLATLGISPSEDRLPAIAAILKQNMGMVSAVMSAPLRPRCENAPVWTLPERDTE